MGLHGLLQGQLHKTDQKVFVIKIVYSSGGSSVCVKSQRRREFSVCAALSTGRTCEVT
jgi:hypothetical protein